MRNAPALAKLTVPALALLLAACSGAAPVEQTSSEGEEALTANERTAFNFFVAKGLSEVQAAGIVGNLIQESNVLPGSVQAGGPGRGIAQWSVGGRWDHDAHDNLEQYASLGGMAPLSLTTQLDFIWYELTSYSAYGLKALRTEGTVAGATVVFQNDFEGCGQCDQATRIHYAEQVLAAYGTGGGSSGSTGSTESTCYSSTLGKTMQANACVQSRSNRLWYQCDAGHWVDRWNDPTACSGVYPL
jgi:hypothetical protein